MSQTIKDDQKSVKSLSTLPSDVDLSMEGYQDSLHEQVKNNYQKDVPLDLRTVTNEAVSRQLSRIQSRLSSTHTRDGDEVLDEEATDPEKQLETVNSRAKFDRFSTKTKYICLGIASMSGFLSPLNSLAILPAIPEIADTFSTTTEVINISNAIYCIFMSLSPCLFSPCSDIYGRRPMFFICCVLYCISNILVAVSQNLAMFFIFRCASALFGTSFFSIGGHIVSDIYHPDQRGRAIAFIILGAQLGTGFGAFLGGVIVNFTSWRVILWVMTGIGAAVLAIAIFFLPETALKTKHAVIIEEMRKLEPKRKFVFVPFNPFKIMTALKYPNLSIDGFIAIATVYTMFMLQTPIREVLEPRFGLTKPLYSGLFYLSPGFGYLVGSFIGGPWADHVVKKYTKIKGRRIPEDRLRTVLIPLGIIYPVSTLIYGWTVQYEKGGMAVPIIFLFFGGVSQTCIFPASNAYCIDSMPELGGDGIASSYFSRYIAAAVASATCLRSINTIGLGWTCTIAAFILWAATACALILIYFGEKLRINALIRYGLREKDEFVEEKD